MSHYTRSVTGTLLILVIAFCSAFLVSNCRGVGRVDTTDAGVFTLSKGSKNIIDGLQQQLTMKFFYSSTALDNISQDQVASIKNSYYYVRDLLRSYRDYSDGKLQLQELDPVEYSDAEAEADRLGVQRVSALPDGGLYFGLAVTSDSGDQAVVPVFDVRNQSQIEYQISEAIESATTADKTKLGVLSSLDITGDGMSAAMRQMMQMQGQQVSQPWGTIDTLKRFYEVVNVEAETDVIDADVDYLLVVHPKNLPDQTLYAIDQFVMRGGRLICFVDPYAPFADPPPQQNQMMGQPNNHDSSSNLNRLLSAWGVEVQPNRFAGDQELMKPMRTQRGPANMIGFLGLNQRRGDRFVGVNPDEAPVQGLSQELLVYFGGEVSRAGESESEVELVPLLRTTESGNTFTAQKSELQGFMGGPPDGQALMKKFSPGVSHVAIAARVTGTLKSAFPNGDPTKPAETDATDEDASEADAAEDNGEGDAAEGAETDEGAAADASHLTATSEPTTFIVCADVDMLADPLCFQRFGQMLIPTSGNPEFLLNIVDYTAGSSDLMSIRSRGNFARPFEVVDGIERQADVDTQAKVQEFQAKIEEFDKQLAELRTAANEQNVGLLQGEAIQKRRKLEAEKREAQRQINELQKGKNDRIEGLKSRLQFLNVVAVPALVALVGVGLAFARAQRRKANTGGAR